MGIDCKTVRIFAYSSSREQSNKRSGTRACEARALRARKTLTPRVTDFFTDFEKKTDCFAVYDGKDLLIYISDLNTMSILQDSGSLQCFLETLINLSVVI